METADVSILVVHLSKQNQGVLIEIIIIIIIHTIKPTSALILKLYFLHTIYLNSDIFWSILFIIVELLNVSIAYIKI